MKSEVYFVPLKSKDLKERCAALEKVLERARPFTEYKKGEFIPVKLTIGDKDCVYNVSPELVKIVVSGIKAAQAKPFLFDTNVIYQGERMNAVDHLNLAESKGFTHSKVGAPFIIADGVFGQDGQQFKIQSDIIGAIKVPSFVGMLDSLVVLSHATGHIVSGYAGAIKNVAMGMVARATKQVEHSSLKPSVMENKCTACGCCIKICPVQAISFVKDKARINQKVCLGCGECLAACKFYAVSVNWQEDARIFAKRMAEVALAILNNFKNKFYITFAFDITKECDCISNAKEKMLSRDLGILVSRDIVSLDKATLDLLGLEESKDPYLKEAEKIGRDIFSYAAQKGLGNLEYTLINPDED